MKIFRSIITVTVALLMFAITPVNADELSDLKKQIQELNDKVDIMEAMSGDDDPNAPSIADLSGYYDFTYVDDSLGGSNGTFRQHHFSLFVGKKINKFNLFSEIEFEFGPKIELDGGSIGGTDKAEILVETAWLEYSFSNYLTVRTGKHLTPYGWWNQNHYPILVMTTSRPESSRRIFPTTSTGIQLYGSVFAGSVQADYTLYYVNDIDNSATNRTDADNNKGVGGRLALSLPVLDEFTIGFSAMGGRSNNTNSDQLWGIDELIQVGSFELLGEYSYKDTKVIDTNVKDVQRGYYIQPSVYLPVPDSIGRLAFVYRHEYLNLSKNSVNSRDKTFDTIGLKYQPIPDVAVKGEFSWVDPERRVTDYYHEIQFSITIYY